MSDLGLAMSTLRLFYPRGVDIHREVRHVSNVPFSRKAKAEKIYFGISEISLFARPKSVYIHLVPSHRGAYRDRHGRGTGCDGRGSAGRAR
jgi:hypothetical protein